MYDCNLKSPSDQNLVPPVSRNLSPFSSQFSDLLHLGVYQVANTSCLVCLSIAIFKLTIFEHVLGTLSPSIHPSNHVDILVKCSGLMASRLGGVGNKTLDPARGQIVVVRNEEGKMLNVFGTDDGDDVCYMVTPASYGDTILGVSQNSTETLLSE
ncbi:hypothetical protein BO94DRAFT_66561 [Aspergillus sclerotioniger CBS 115572]|uniref:Uncharacterized protein n=1 Tax=Aspergillus sclerotioniger CBS 115572 TaxID=1450535 RepID=A0A317WP93_9EURO|nr:hypothetical protein BO94DRAFT_66561 [Aspergillus sclerotioniger CBS 115572]PWY87072.1 hypothetical protein BO94DRAFT_66561 [Aspergillus sclerotioniger CBS 115572]